METCSVLQRPDKDLKNDSISDRPTLLRMISVIRSLETFTWDGEMPIPSVLISMP